MFGLGVTEILVILIVAFLLFGPQQLPEVGRQVGKAIKGFKKSVHEPEPQQITDAQPGVGSAASDAPGGVSTRQETGKG